MELMKTNIEHKVLIKAPREKVFKAMTTPEGLNSWFTKDSTKEAGKLHLRWKNWGADKGDYTSENLPIIEDNFPERFVFKWWLETNNPT
ncbi:MAG: SRPBCC family protein [Promethearchaeota archaeon]